MTDGVWLRLVERAELGELLEQLGAGERLVQRASDDERLAAREHHVRLMRRAIVERLRGPSVAGSVPDELDELLELLAELEAMRSWPLTTEGMRTLIVKRLRLGAGL